MDTTRPSLLIRVKDARDTLAWSEFHELYAPLLYRYARASGLGHEDAEDVRSTCYESIVKQIADFDYDKQKGGFKAWLRTIVRRRVVDLLRKRRERPADTHQLSELPDSDPAVEELWETHWKQQHLRFCVERVREQVPEATYSAFRLLLDEVPVPQICEQLGLSANQVYKAKARVLQLVRGQMSQIYDSEVPG